MLEALGGGLGSVLAARAAGVSRSRAGVSRSQAGVSRSRAREDENIGSLTLLGSLSSGIISGTCCDKFVVICNNLVIVFLMDF